MEIPKKLQNPCCKRQGVRVEQYASAFVELKSDGHFDIKDIQQGDLDWDAIYCDGCGRNLCWDKPDDDSYALTKRIIIPLCG